MNKTQLMMMFSINPFENDANSLYSNKHVMTNKELVNQVWGYTAEIQRHYLSANTPIFIATKPMPRNGARIVVRLLNEVRSGYACTVYSISRRVNIVGEICDMFERGLTVLSDEDCELCREEATE